MNIYANKSSRPTFKCVLRKSWVKYRIERKIEQTLMINGRRKDWYLTRSRDLSIYATFSKADQLFYDINPADLNDWITFPSAFVVFVMGTHTELLIIPARRLKKLIEILPPKGNGDIKLHILHSSAGFEFREIPQEYLSHYYNNFDQFLG